METDTHSPQTDEPSLDTTLRLLRDPRRRALVSILADHEPPVSLTDLAAAVAARELETDASGVSNDADVASDDAGVSNDADDPAGASDDATEVPNDPGEVPPAEAKSVAATLHHLHLPKLAANGIVAYDAEQKTVTDTHVEAVAPLSNLSDDLDC